MWCGEYLGTVAGDGMQLCKSCTIERDVMIDMFFEYSSSVSITAMHRTDTLSTRNHEELFSIQQYSSVSRQKCNMRITYARVS